MKLLIDSKDAKHLRYIKVAHKHGLIEGNFPDYLILGPQRTGTTWFAANLRYHPDIFLSYPKELYFFNRLTLPNSNRSFHYENFSWKLAHRSLKEFVREAIKLGYFEVYKTGRYKANQLEWYMRFFESDPLTQVIKRMEGEYVETAQNIAKVIGEATASYAVLDKDIIREIVTLNPNLKAIIMVRDPVERAWSHAKKDLVRRNPRHYKEVSKKEFYRFFSSEYQIKCGLYTQAIANWEIALKPDHLFIGLYDDLQRRPKEFLLDIFRFLGVREEEQYISEKKAIQIINRTDHTDLPEDYRLYLESIFAEEKQRLEERYKLSW